MLLIWLRIISKDAKSRSYDQIVFYFYLTHGKQANYCDADESFEYLRVVKIKIIKDESWWKNIQEEVHRFNTKFINREKWRQEALAVYCRRMRNDYYKRMHYEWSNALNTQLLMKTRNVEWQCTWSLSD